MILRKKPKPPIRNAMRLIDQALEIAYVYKRDRKRLPSDDELKDLDILLESFWQSHCTLDYIIRCLRQRKAGEKEGGNKWTNPRRRSITIIRSELRWPCDKPRYGRAACWR